MTVKTCCKAIKTNDHKFFFSLTIFEAIFNPIHINEKSDLGASIMNSNCTNAIHLHNVLVLKLWKLSV